jgi:hypothetical protein
MQLQKRKIDWESFASAHVVFGLPIFLAGLTFLSEPRWLAGLPMLVGIFLLVFHNRKALMVMLFPFSIEAGRGTARYLALLGLAWYTFGRIELIPESNFAAQRFCGLLLLGLAALWYIIRRSRFGETSL